VHMKQSHESPLTSTQKTTEYISNPFVSTFRGLGRLFDVNQTLTIIALVVGLFWQFGQMWSPFPGGGDSSTNTSGSTIEPVLIAIIICVVLAAIIFGVVISVYVSGLYAYLASSTIRKKTVGLGDAIRAVSSKFATLLWALFIVFLKIFGGFLLFIIPGIRASLRYAFVPLMIIHDDMNAKQAIKTSKQQTKGRLMEIFGIQTVGTIVPIVGGLLLIGGQVIYYPQMVAWHTSGQPKPKTHWLNYLGILLILLLLALVAGITLLIIALI